MADAIYEGRDGLYVPTIWAGGPWSARHQHGAPVLGLFAREAEAFAQELGLAVVRLTTDLFRPVPLEPLEVTTRVTRRGRRIGAIEMSLRRPGEDDSLCRGSALLLGSSSGSEVEWSPAAPVPPPPQGIEPVASTLPKEVHDRLPPGFHLSLDLRAGADDVGPFVWATTPLRLIDGEPITPFQRACALSDMTLGMQMSMLRRTGGDAPARVFMINADTTTYWERPFVGDHLGFRGSLLTEKDGVGVAEAILYDSVGRVGRSTQGALLQTSLA